MKKKRFKNEKYNELVTTKHEFKAEYNEQTNTTKLVIYGDIGDYWWDSVSDTDVERVLRGMTSDTIHVHINSPGGDAFMGIAIYNQLKNHSAKVVVHIDGWACSAASIIAMAGDEVIMHTGSMMMIHSAAILTYGNKEELGKTVELLTKLDDSIIDLYMTRFSGEREELETMLDNETWFTGEEAIAIGLADKTGQAIEDTEDETEKAEAFKNNVLARFVKQSTSQTDNKNASAENSEVPASNKNTMPINEPAASAKNILERFKRNSNE